MAERDAKIEYRVVTTLTRGDNEDDDELSDPTTVIETVTRSRSHALAAFKTGIAAHDMHTVLMGARSLKRARPAEEEEPSKTAVKNARLAWSADAESVPACLAYSSAIGERIAWLEENKPRCYQREVQNRQRELERIAQYTAKLRQIQDARDNAE